MKEYAPTTAMASEICGTPSKAATRGKRSLPNAVEAAKTCV